MEKALQSKNTELDKTVKLLEEDLYNSQRKRDSLEVENKSLRDKVRALELELEVNSKELEIIQKNKLQSTGFQSGLKSVVSGSLSPSGQVRGSAGSVVRSPKGEFLKG